MRGVREREASVVAKNSKFVVCATRRTVLLSDMRVVSEKAAGR